MAGNHHSGGGNRRSVRQHRVAGTYRPHRHRGLAHPQAPKGAPQRPTLGPIARGEWDRMVRELEQCGALFVTDRAMLYAYVQLYDWTETRARALADVEGDIRRVGDVIGRVKGDGILSALGALADLRKTQVRLGAQVASGRKALRPFLVEFGFSPASRSRVRLSAEDPEAADDFTTFQQQRGQVTAFPRPVA